MYSPVAHKMDPLSDLSLLFAKQIQVGEREGLALIWCLYSKEKLLLKVQGKDTSSSKREETT